MKRLFLSVGIQRDGRVVIVLLLNTKSRSPWSHKGAEALHRTTRKSLKNKNELQQIIRKHDEEGVHELKSTWKLRTNMAAGIHSPKIKVLPNSWPLTTAGAFRSAACTVPNTL